MDPDTKELLNILLKNENRLVDYLRKLSEHQNRNEDSIQRLVTAADKFIASADAYVQASHERLGLVEKQLDALVRAITLKPTNGKSE
jgi:membrane-bound ClpP family serine protease